ncbi:acetyltransferase [Vibrio metoecus]|nr:acetyltransferase [Vibrio metoecus]WKY95222.1 acetyltransferase [Vibrio metoecus]
MVTVVVFEFRGMRCQPLRRALCAFLLNTPFLLIHP